jgi:hypothetical protein
MSCHVLWWLGITVLEDYAASIFRIEVHGEGKVDIDIGRV